MSDLAPFVAATIRDEVVADAQEENRVLHKRLRESERITVTGKGNSPVYAEGYLSEATFVCAEPQIDLANCTGENADEKLAMCKAQDFTDAEIRLGGTLV